MISATLDVRLPMRLAYLSRTGKESSANSSSIHASFTEMILLHTLASRYKSMKSINEIRLVFPDLIDHCIDNVQ